MNSDEFFKILENKPCMNVGQIKLNNVREVVLINHGRPGLEQLINDLTLVIEQTLPPESLLTQTGKGSYAFSFKGNLEQAEAIARNLIHAIDKFAVEIEETLYYPKIMIGLTNHVGRPRHTLVALKRASDEARRKGNSAVHIVDQTKDAFRTYVARLLRQRDIRLALQYKQFVLSSQPIVPLRKNRSGNKFELLLGVRHKDTIVSPRQYIEAASFHEVMPEIDQYVIRHAFAGIQDLYGPSYEDLGGAFINLSGQSVRDYEGLIGCSLESAHDYDVPPEKITFELTEDVVASDFNKAISAVRGFQQHGFRVAIDDCGKGSSGLGFLPRIMHYTDFIKIDGEFIEGMVSGDLRKQEYYRNVVRFLTEAGHSYKNAVVAEHVSKKDLSTLAQVMGIDFGQGRHFGMPKLWYAPR